MSPIFELRLALPLIFVAGSALLVLVLSAVMRRSGLPLACLSGIGLLAAWAANVSVWHARGETAYGMLRIDEFAVFFNFIFLLVGLLAVFSSVGPLERSGTRSGEYYALVLMAVAGMMIMASSRNLLVIVVGLEVLSIPLYVLAGITRMRLRSVEAALKYFLLGAFSTGFILYGLAFIYGAAGTLRLPDLLAGEPSAPMLLLGAALVLIGFAFKIAAVPFHFWAPDVYEGAPTTVTALMAAGTKAAAFAALARILASGFGGESLPALLDSWRGAVVALSVLTMTVGNLVALAQTNIKRLLAYSAIAHAGYLLIAVATLGVGLSPGAAETGRATAADDAVQVLAFYLLCYALMTMGAFLIASRLGREGPEEERGYAIASYAGLGWRRPVPAALMTLFLLSLAGLPPTAGFVAKFYLFKSAYFAGLVGLAIFGVLNSVLAAAYYLKVVVAMYMKEPEAATDEPVRSEPLGAYALAIAAAGTLYLGLFPGKWLDFAHRLYGSMR